MRNNLKNNSFSTFIGSTPDIEINLICLIYTVNLRIKRFIFYSLYVTFCCFHSTNLLFTLPKLHYYHVHDRLVGVTMKTFILTCLRIFHAIQNIFFQYQGGHSQSATKFPDLSLFSLTKFYFSLTKILSIYGIFLFLQLINEKYYFLAH